MKEHNPLDDMPRSPLDEMPTIDQVRSRTTVENEQLRRKLTAIQEIVRAHRPGGLPPSKAKEVLDLAFVEFLNPPAEAEQLRAENERLRAADADLWRAKAVQLAAALEEACGIAEWESEEYQGKPEHGRRIPELRALLDGKLAEPLERLEHLRNVVDATADLIRASSADVTQLLILFAAAREVVR